MQTTPSSTADDVMIQGVTQIHLTILIQYGDTQKPQHRDTYIQKEMEIDRTTRMVIIKITTTWILIEVIYLLTNQSKLQ